MFEWFVRRVRARNRAKDKVDEWKLEVLTKLIDFIMPEKEPYYYDSAFSFMQSMPGATAILDNPVRVDLFLPDFPLAIDVVGADSRTNYLDSQKYISRQEWSIKQSELSAKAEKLGRYQCPYLVIRDSDPVDLTSIKHQIKVLTDRALRS